MSPTEEYAQRLGAREAQVGHLEKIHVRIANVRLLLALSLAATGWLALQSQWFSLWWLLIPIAAFIGAAMYHLEIGRARSAAQRAAAFY